MQSLENRQRIARCIDVALEWLANFAVSQYGSPYVSSRVESPRECPLRPLLREMTRTQPCRPS